jgi:hypothetical protein
MPCTIVCLTPVVIAAWPAISAAFVGTAAMLGFEVAKTAAKTAAEIGVDIKTASTVDVELKGSAVLEGYAGQEVKVSRGETTVTVNRSEFGRLVVSAEGTEPKSELLKMAEAFAAQMQQVYSYNKAMNQLRMSGFNVVAEEVTKDKEINVTLRRF